MYNPYFYNQNYNYQQNQRTGDFVTVQCEEEARSYPIAHGTSVMFRDENSPYIYSKTLGFGQLDIPVFEKYRLVKETRQDAQKPPFDEKVDELSAYVRKGELDPLRSELEALKDAVEKLRRDLGDEHI